MARELFDAYARQTADVRELSSPKLDAMDGPREYSERLRENFHTIGLLARQNRKILDEVIFPLIESEDILSEETVADMRALNEQLVNGADLENLDISIMALLSDRLMRDAEAKHDKEYIITQLDERIIASYSLMYMTSRIETDPSISEHFRQDGMDALRQMRAYLEPEEFKQLTPKEREAVLTATRYGVCLYEHCPGVTPEIAAQWLAYLHDVIAVYEDPFYHEVAPEFDWDYYLFRALEHHGNILDHLYEGELPQDELDIIVERLRWMERLWMSNPREFQAFAPLDFVHVNLYCAEHRAGNMSVEEYRHHLLEMYWRRNPHNYDYDHVYLNLTIPLDYILTLDAHHTTEHDLAQCKHFYEDACAYAHRMPNSGTLTAMLDLFSALMMHFTEVPGDISYEEMCLRALAAFHPPTYVHSMMVAQISRCLARHAIEVSPEQLVGALGTRSVDEVRADEDRILDYIYHAGLLHDAGKLPLVDTIFIYGRKLLDFEFDVIKQHPSMGAEMLRRHDSTRAYVDVAQGHHRWYDGSQGYPETLDAAILPLKPIIDIVTVADCMDAATDSVGRSYNQGKTLDEFLEELIEGSGTRYAAWVSDLLERDEVVEDVDYLLSHGRAENYRNAYRLLRRVEEHEDESIEE